MPLAPAQIETQEGLISFRNGEGIELQATLLTMTPFQVVFEVCGPASVLRMSEVLNEFRILVQDRPIYSGRAVVTNLVNTGSVLVCEAGLQEFWVEGDVFSLASEPDRLRSGFDHFLRQWEKVYKVRPQYKVVIADLQTFLADLRLWLEQVELGIRSLPSTDRLNAEREAVGELAPSITPALSQFFERFETAAGGIEEELRHAHAAFCRRQLHPYLMASPFMHRIYVKPLGYAGDYEMVNMILRDPCEGGSLFAKLLNVFILDQSPAIAHRNRVAYLTRKLVEEASRQERRGRPTRILNLGCGPAKEVQDFLIHHELSERTEFDLLDFDDETLAHGQRVLEAVKRSHRRGTTIRMVKKSVHQILKQAGKPRVDGQNYDFIYCAGLFDYLNQRTCKSLMNYFYESLAPGGLLVATNVDEGNPIRNIMEYMYEWHLIYRNSKLLAALSPDGALPDTLTLQTEASGGNIFVEVRKPQTGS